MVIDQAIVDRAGRILISRNTVLDAYHIDAFVKMGIPGIYIREGEEDEETEQKKPDDIMISPAVQNKIEKQTVKDRAKVKLSESVKARVAEGIQYLYNDTVSEGFTSTTRSITNDLMKAISDNDAIAVDISTLKISDEYTFKHSVDVATMAMIVGKKHGLSKQEVYELGISGLLHDVGKSKIPNEILNKAGKLTDDEFMMMKQHSLYGYQILKEKEDLSTPIKLGVLQHHEKMNAKGYPMGVPAEKINLFARIISVADIYDALVTERPYKKPFSPRDAVEMIMSLTDELDIDVMKSFLESVILYPVGTDVELSIGERARVVENNSQYVLRPKVVGLKTGKTYDLSAIENANIIVL
ncbi:MAG: HD-GYP domain-containing protein [Lachnospiraceae bacterium]|nr:HD-GYP domain-containing protein [Lachnospiraceae bacterium]